MKSRYIYCPMTSKKLGHRTTLAERFRLWKRRRMAPDLYMVTGFNAPYYPSK